MPIDPSKITFGDETGAVLRTQHMERRVRVYPITEIEIKELKLFDTLGTFFWSVGFGFLSFSGGLIFDVSIDMPDARATPSAYGSAILCGIIGIFFAGFAIWATLRKKSAYYQIQQPATGQPKKGSYFARRFFP